MADLETGTLADSLSTPAPTPSSPRTSPWRGARLARLGRPGELLKGFGLFNSAEGAVDRHLPGIHRVSEAVPLYQRVHWDSGPFL
ncbi:hypothetical protein GCM10009416_23810 [Craurococcus roseus]|uniref:Uncharacterized protein n=1 Tax=Craurococcus roseus TaxID=77585 RepID=A0ABP3Q725_9PROT